MHYRIRASTYYSKLRSMMGVFLNSMVLPSTVVLVTSWTELRRGLWLLPAQQVHILRRESWMQNAGHQKFEVHSHEHNIQGFQREIFIPNIFLRVPLVVGFRGLLDDSKYTREQLSVYPPERFRRGKS